MQEFHNSSAAVAAVEDQVSQGEPTNGPPNQNSPYILVNPPTQFEGAMGTADISVKLDSSQLGEQIALFRANPGSAWVFTQLDTQVVDGRAVAQTDQGGIFVAGSGVNFTLIVGLVVGGLVLLLVVTIVVGTIVYFIARPEKWKATKNSIKKSQMKLKRSFAKQV